MIKSNRAGFSLSNSLALALGLSAVTPSAVLAQEWIAGTGSWFKPENWNPSTVPVAGDFAIISNGGAAILDAAVDGVSTTPLLNGLAIGRTSFGTGTGAVSSDGVAMITSGAITAGLAFNVAGDANGSLTIAGAGAQASTVNAGFVFNSGAVATTAQGSVDIDGQLLLTGGNFLQIGQIFNAANGSSATGSVRSIGDAGNIGGALIVGNVTANNDAQVGNHSSGQLGILGAGDLTLAAGTAIFIGSTGGPDRVTDVGGTRINSADGSVEIDGTLRLSGAPGTLALGRTTGGHVDGTLSLGALDMAGERFSFLGIGTAAHNGVASGTLNVGSGDLLTSGSLRVGHATGGTAQGSVALGGGVHGDGGGVLQIGVGTDDSGRVVQANGIVNAAEMSGFTGLHIGTLTGDVGDGSVAHGALISSGSGNSGSVQALSVGFKFNGGAGEAVGELALGGPLTFAGNFLQVGQMFNSAGGSRSSGTVTLGGDGGEVGSALIVGNVTANNDAQVGSQSAGQFSILNGGGLTLAADVSSFIGTTFGRDQVSDASGTRINNAEGTVMIDGALRILGATGNDMSIGRTGDGLAQGTLSVGSFEMAAGDSLNNLNIGISDLGQAQGLVNSGGGVLRVDSLRVGSSNGGIAEGRLMMENAQLEAGDVLAGIGDGAFGYLSLVDSAASVARDMTLETGVLALDRSLVDVGNSFVLGDNAQLNIGIDGVVRGGEYGAVNALVASLAGELLIDLSNLTFGSSAMMFDLVLSGSADGISGDFSSVTILGLQDGYVANAGLVLDGVEIYRLRLNQIAVPAPMTLALLALGLVGMLGGRIRSSKPRF